MNTLLRTTLIAGIIVFSGCDDDGRVRLLNDERSSDERIPFNVVSCPVTSDYTLLEEHEVDDPFEVVLTDPHEFRELYLTIDPNNQEEIPSIDFDEERAVFIYLGQQTVTYPYVRIKEVTRDADGIMVRYEDVQPPSGCFADNAISEPYCIISIENTEETVRFSSTVVEECS